MTLYATDLDGTLLGADASLSSEQARKFRSLLEQGRLITFVTARTPATIEPILAQAHPTLPGVAMTGSTIWNPAKRAYESVTYHNGADVRAIAEICRRHGVAPFVYTMRPGSNQLVVYHESEALTPVEQHFIDDRTLNDLKVFNLHTPAPVATEDYTVLYFAMGEPELIKKVAEEISATTSCYASWYPDTYNPGLSLLEVFAPGVSKARGLLNLKQLLGADRVVAFGDNLNDIPMLQAADLAVVVDNAHPEVKAVADVIIGPNTSGSVLDFIAQQPV